VSNQKPDNPWYDDGENQPFDLETAPLDNQGICGGIDWGDDGSDPYRPNRIHVLAALQPTDEPYPPPVDALRSIGHPEQKDIIYPAELNQQHLHDLVRMARDRSLNTAFDNTNDVWAPIHAVYVLTELDISSVVEDLIPLLDLDQDWYDVTLARKMGQTGHAALQPLQTYLYDQSRWVYGRWRAADCLKEIGVETPELRNDVVATLSKVLENAADQSPEFNGGIIGNLQDLSASEALPVIRRAFELNSVDELIVGNWLDVLHHFGQEPDENDPLIARAKTGQQRKRMAQPKKYLDPLGFIDGQEKTGPGKNSPQKKKRKQQKSSRKANRPAKKRKR
jgi:hypothetical protein